MWCKASSPGQAVNIGLTSNFGTIPLPANSRTRVSHTSVVPNSNPVTAFASSSYILMFGAQCVASPGPGAYAKTPEGLGYHPYTRFDSDVLKIQSKDFGQSSVNFSLAEFQA